MAQELNRQLKTAQTNCEKLCRRMKSYEESLAAIKTEYKRATAKLQVLQCKKTCEENKQKVAIISRTLNSDWVEKRFDWSDTIIRLLKHKFKLRQFRAKQLAAINATLSKKDVLLVMPTGAGKSLVYELPALIDSRFTIVVSPLISLIEDQLIALRKLEIEAAAVHGKVPRDEIKQIYEKMKDKESDLRLVYVTPEWLANSKRFMSLIKKCYAEKRIARVAIDEVHCCSGSSQDFRPDYRYLGVVRQTLSRVPFLGVTATASMTVLSDVQIMLNLKNTMILTAPFNIPNLFYQVLLKPNSKEAVLDYLTKVLKTDFPNQSGIIYTNTINDCNSLATDLTSKGLKVGAYHASLDAQERKDVHKKWLQADYQVVIATVAFGMGIDKPDVRFVIHHTIPKSVENLYQESGRAGRDGLEAHCIVLFSLTDYLKNTAVAQSVVEDQRAWAALEYCLDETTCRRAMIATKFEEVWDKSNCKKMCDHCKNGDTDLAYYDLTSACVDLHLLLDKADDCEQMFTLLKLLDAWYQTGPKRYRIPTVAVPQISREKAEVIVAFLVQQKYLEVDKGYNAHSCIAYISKGNELDEGEKIEMLTSKTFPGFPKRFPPKPQNAEDGPAVKKVRIE